MEQYYFDSNMQLDWVYTMREVLNSKIFSNPLTMSDIIDLTVDELGKVFGDRAFNSFNFHDEDRTITVRIPTEDNKTELVNKVVEGIMWRFCAAYISSIETAIVDCKGRGLYLQVFDDTMQSRNCKLLAQLVTVNCIFMSQSKEMMVSLRFY